MMRFAKKIACENVL
jgi:hypothetical protein